MVSAAARPPRPHGAPLPPRPAAAGGEPRMARSVPAPAGHRGAWAQLCRRLRTVAARVPAAKLCAGWEVGARSRRAEGPPPPPPRARERAGPRRAPAPRAGGSTGANREPCGGSAGQGRPRLPAALRAPGVLGTAPATSSAPRIPSRQRSRPQRGRGSPGQQAVPAVLCKSLSLARNYRATAP